MKEETSSGVDTTLLVGVVITVVVVGTIALSLLGFNLKVLAPALAVGGLITILVAAYCKRSF